MNFRSSDARLYQIVFLASLLLFGVLLRDFSIQPAQIFLTFIGGLATQAIFLRTLKLKDVGYRSAFVSCLGLCLLLRADNLWVHPLAAAFANSAKFLIRIRGKHIFNPANFGVIASLFLLPGAWVSPGQWGNDVTVAAFVLILGVTVVWRAARSDASWAFLGTFALLLLLRTTYLGQRWAVASHQLQSGSLLLFSFFMISDPKTLPDRKGIRILYCAAVAVLAFTIQKIYFRPNALFFALFWASFTVPVLDRWFPGSPYRWSTPREDSLDGGLTMKRSAMATLGALSLFLLPASAQAFCGFYVAKADASLYNKASQVVLVRDGQRTVLSMLNDYQGDLKEFALVVPVPVVLQKGQINVGEKKLFDHIDAFSAPRLVEYFDPDPCQQNMYEGMRMGKGRSLAAGAPMTAFKAKALGVTVEASYTVGEYDIVILSAKESDGLETWLTQSGYKIPKGVSKALQPYIKQNLKFFVAKVNIKEQAKTGLTYLRPIQFAFESEKFMLPIRLGMINAKGPQDLLIYVLTRTGRVETTNYRTVKLPTDSEIPLFVKNDFASFYKALFETQAKKENDRAVFTEYFWNMGWCDPCAADPLSPEELRQLGVFWIADASSGPKPVPGFTRRPGIMPFPSSPLQVMVTRLHVRYAADTFPEDLMFQETQDQANFQARYVLRHPWNGDENKCSEARTYFQDLENRKETEAQTLATLTGWEINDVRKKVGAKVNKPPNPWWETLWK